MRWFLYNLLFTVGYMLVLPRFLFRMWRRGGYAKDFLQRLAVYKPEVIRRLGLMPRIWVHAVSVGEIYVALKFIEGLRAFCPGKAFVLTTTTSTGHRIAESLLNQNDVLLYFPADFPFVIERVLNAIKPVGVILTEGELWPNLIRQAKRRGVPVMMINGRVSESSFRGYSLVRAFIEPVLKMMDMLLVQDAVDRERLIMLGAEEARVKVLGSAKYDVAQFDTDGEVKARKILSAAGILDDDPVIVGGSTWPGEEELLLDIVRKIKARSMNVKLVLVPRHAERSEEVERLVRDSGLAYLKRTDLDRPETEGSIKADVLLVNTTGELKNFYSCASVIFVGKSMTSHGGQNIIEPALFGKPVIVVPNMENFASVVDDFRKADAVIQVHDAGELELVLESLLADTGKRSEYGQRAEKVVKENRGVMKKSAEVLSHLITAGPAI